MFWQPVVGGQHMSCTRMSEMIISSWIMQHVIVCGIICYWKMAKDCLFRRDVYKCDCVQLSVCVFSADPQ